MTPFISIVLPVFRVEKYIHGTLESIYSQKVEDDCFEVVVVDDETPDNSMQIVEEFAAVHRNITVIHQKNRGLSGARNTGLEAARGEYVWFMDSDDKAVGGSLELIRNTIVKSGEDADIYGFGIYTEDENSGKQKYFEPLTWWRGKNPYGRAVNYMTMGNHTMGPTARYAFRREFLTRTRLRFWEGILHEDVDFLNKAFFMAGSIWLSKEVIYVYRERSDGSIMSTIKMKSFHDLLKICKSFEALRDSGKGKTYWDSVMWRTVTIMQNARIRGHGLAKEEMLEYYRFLDENRAYFRLLTMRGIIASIKSRAWKDIALGIKGLTQIH